MKSKPTLVTLITTLLLTLTTTLLPAQDMPPEKIEALKTRFKEGMDLMGNGKLSEALAKFEANIKEAPTSPGSLFFGGDIALRLGQYEKAADYLEAFLKLKGEQEWQRGKAMEYAIQANQALKKNVKVARLRGEYITLRNQVREAGKTIPDLTNRRGYVRERIELPNGKLAAITEYFDFRNEPYLLYTMDQLDASGRVLERQLCITYDAESTAKLRQERPNLPRNQTEVYSYFEPIFVGGEPTEYRIYDSTNGQPTYDAARNWLLKTYENPPKPLTVAKPSAAEGASQ